MNKFTLPAYSSLLLVAVISLFVASCFQSKQHSRRNMTIVFYNVENLFDTINTPGSRDGEFTPEGSKKWIEARYQKKLEDLSRVVAGINEKDLPEIVGICEVENEQVVKDLVQTDRLIDGNYHVIHYESPDFRGIDCALFYRPEEFKVVYHAAVPVHFSDSSGSETRDILYVKGFTSRREEFHVFVNHWPSRIGGVAETEPERMDAAGILRSKIDSIQQVKQDAHIIVMGDMNDEPDNRSLLMVLDARPPKDSTAELVNLMFPEFTEGKGSYKYRGNWNMLDNIIVSATLFESKGWKVIQEKGFIYREPWMEYVRQNGEISPNRTYGGSDYFGGVSDHFPVYFRLKR